MNRRTDKGQATRAHLVDVATRLFTECGYDGTSIEAVLRESGVSRGALYHHFGGKDALFAAVLDAVYERVGQDMAAATADRTDAVSGLRLASLAWVRLAREPTVQQIMLIDAPAVLGWQRWREIDEQRTLGQVKAALVATGLLPAQHVDFFAHTLLASMNEIALMIARAEDPAATAADAEGAVDELLSRLLRR